MKNLRIIFKTYNYPDEFLKNEKCLCYRKNCNNKPDKNGFSHKFDKTLFHFTDDFFVDDNSEKSLSVKRK